MSIAASPSALQPGDYEKIEAAVTATARGRAFLAEYGRRAGAAETESLRASLARIEARLDSLGVPPAADAIPVIERLDALAWKLRESGVDDFVCAKIEALAREIAACGLASDLPPPAPPQATPREQTLLSRDEALELAEASSGVALKSAAAAKAGQARTDEEPPAPHPQSQGEPRTHAVSDARDESLPDATLSIKEPSAAVEPPARDPRLEALLWLDGLPLLDRMALFA